MPITIAVQILRSNSVILEGSKSSVTVWILTIWQQQRHKELSLPLSHFLAFSHKAVCVTFPLMNIHELTLEQNAVKLNDIN